MDLSDGLGKDLHALTPKAAEPAIIRQSIPRRAGATVRAALTDGEDYELLFVVDHDCNSEEFERLWRRAFPRVRLSRIGQFVPEGLVPSSAVQLKNFQGYEHLRR
jgi:thiamine-monophosphate kinase